MAVERVAHVGEAEARVLSDLPRDRAGEQVAAGVEPALLAHVDPAGAAAAPLGEQPRVAGDDDPRLRRPPADRGVRAAQSRRELRADETRRAVDASLADRRGAEQARRDDVGEARVVAADRDRDEPHGAREALELVIEDVLGGAGGAGAKRHQPAPQQVGVGLAAALARARARDERLRAQARGVGVAERDVARGRRRRTGREEQSEEHEGERRCGTYGSRQHASGIPVQRPLAQRCVPLPRVVPVLGHAQATPTGGWVGGNGT